MDRFGVFLVDRNRLVREGIKRLLADAAFDVTGEAEEIKDAIGALPCTGETDLLIVDVTVWRATETKRLFDAARAQGLKTVVLTGDRSPASINEAVGCSVDAYLLKDMSPEVLTRALQLVMLGQQILPTALLAPALHKSGAPPASPANDSSMNDLSMREVQILRHLMNGHSNREIAQALGVSESTVKVHLKALLRKMQVANRTQAATWAMSNGLGGPAARTTAA
jgi:two-component system, NarL family, nitrate/nitrite response regulator NarL